MTSLVFKMAADDVANQLPVPVRFCICPQKVRISKCTKFGKDISIHGWVITTSGFGKRTAAILKFYFRFQLWLSADIGISFATAHEISCEWDHWRPSYDVMLMFKMVDVSHVVFHVRLWWTTTTCRWWREFRRHILDWSDRCMVFEISQFLDFGNLAWKCIFTPLLGVFGEHFPQVMSLIILTPKGPSFGRTRLFEP